MSPLVRSLLALAALLAAAQADCVTKSAGDTNGTPEQLPDIYIPPEGADVDLDNPCPAGEHIVGVTVTVCNNDPNGPAPDLNLNENDLQHYSVRCPQGCPKGTTAHTTVYCGRG